jgi:hypothetical protein
VSRTPDDFPGKRIDEGLILLATDLLPTINGEMLYISGSGFFFKEQNNIYGPISNFDMTKQRLYEEKTFSVYTENVSNANNKNMLAILNKGGSGMIVRVTGIKIINTTSNSITGIKASFELKRINGFTGTSNVVIQSHDTFDTVPTTIIAGTGGSVLGEATTALNKWFWSTDEWGVGTLDQEGSQLSTQNTFLWEAKRGSKPYTLRENEGIMLVFRGSSSAGTHDILFEIEVATQ